MTTTSWKNELIKPDYPCKKCGQKAWIVGFYTDAAGKPKYPFVCYNCGQRTQHFAKRKAVLMSGEEVHHMHPKTLPFICEVCNKEGAEQHHWAPWHLFDNEANKWPVSYLCEECHKKWHRIVTPNMSNKA